MDKNFWEQCDIVIANANDVAISVFDDFHRRDLGRSQSLGPRERSQFQNGMRFHINYLMESIALDSQPLYLESVQWSKVFLASQGFAHDDVISIFNLLSDQLVKRVSSEIGSKVREYIEAGKVILATGPQITASPHTWGQGGDDPSKIYLDLLIQGKKDAALQYIADQLARGRDIKYIYRDIIQRSQEEVGLLWQSGKLSTAREHYCTAVSQLAMTRMYPAILDMRKDIPNPPKGIVTCVEGELHEFGARMVADFHEMEGWDIMYLGANTPISEIIKMASLEGPKVLFISATMLFNIRRVGLMVEGLKADPTTKKIKTVVGGHSFNVDPNLWRKVGADGYAEDADGAVTISSSFMGGA